MRGMRETADTWRLVASTTLLNYFQLGTETDDMRLKKDVGAWEFQKAAWGSDAIWYLLGIRDVPDALSAIAVRNNERVTFDDDRAVDPRPDRQRSLG
jgi:hypothetical protein